MALAFHTLTEELRDSMSCLTKLKDTIFQCGNF